MGKFVCLLVLLAVIEYSVALKCYTCGTAGIVACDKADKSAVKDCGTLITQDPACLKIVTKDHVEKKCGGIEKTAKLECNVKGDTTTCFCNTDECNGAPSINLSYFAAVGLLLAYLVPKIFVH